MAVNWNNDEKEQFYKLFIILNNSIDDKDRRLWNAYKLQIWDTMEKIRDLSKYPSAKNFGTCDFPELANKLYYLITLLPILDHEEKK